MTWSPVQLDLLRQCGEEFAAGFFEEPSAPAVVRMARGLASHLRWTPLPPWRGTQLYPADRVIGAESSSFLAQPTQAVRFHYSYSMTFDRALLDRKIAQAAGPAAAALTQLREAILAYPAFVRGYTHSIPNYRRILRQGLGSYATRIDAGRAKALGEGQHQKLPFYDAMRIVLDAFAHLHARTVDMLSSLAAPGDQQPRLDALAAALRRVPFAPARTFYEAMVAENFVFFLDGPDNLGRFDQDLIDYYRRSLQRGETTEAEALSLIGEVWRNMDCNTGWNVAIGGSSPDGGAGANELTRLCLAAAQGRRRPNLALRLRNDSPQEVWDEAFDTLATGCGLPALYSEENYLAAIRGCDLGVREEDIHDFAFGGCTELMIHGKSNCGSLDADFNIAMVLDRALGKHLPACDDFDDLLARFKAELLSEIEATCTRISDDQRAKAAHQPQVIRSLLIDDCLDEGVEYNAGGARYNWSVVNIAGIGNAADSLHALREVVYEKREASNALLREALAANFDGHEPLRRRLMQCDHYGNGLPRVDALAADVAGFVFAEFLARRPWRGGRFVPSCLMFVTYGWQGAPVGALPDGRRKGEPIADSAGAVQGRDRSGPTALIRSATTIPQHLAPGTLVINARFSKGLLAEPASRRKLQDLIRAYFRLGGMQIQINAVDQATLQAAYERPADYANLIIRMGGYSEFWGNLDDTLRRSILERVEHTAG